MPDRPRPPATPDSLENATRMRVSRSLHGFWRKAVRGPLKTWRARLRSAMAASAKGGVPVTVDRTTELAVVPFEGRFPPPRAQCTVVEATQYRTRLHPLTVNSTTTEAMHYVEHTVDAPPLTLEHLVDQFWFPKFGLLISEDGLLWRHSFLGPFRRRVPLVGQGDRRARRAGRGARAAVLPEPARGRAEDRRGAAPHRQFREAQLWPLPARHRAADPPRRDPQRPDADLDAKALAARPDRPARRAGRD